jgi:hypothetical protein
MPSMIVIKHTSRTFNPSTGGVNLLLSRYVRIRAPKLCTLYLLKKSV